MKIVVFGLTVSSSWGNGHATLWRGLFQALARRGCHIVFFEQDVPYYAATRDRTDIAGGRLVLYRDWPQAAGEAAGELADADVAIVSSYCPDGIAATDLVLAAPRPLRVFYDLDTPVTLARLDAGQSVGYIGPRGLADFDLVLSYTGGGALDALAQRLGARRTATLYGHVDCAAHRPVPAVEAYRADFSYLGTYAPDRQAALEALFVEPARHLPQRRFLIGGALYPADFPWTPNIFFTRHLPPDEHPAFYSSSRLTLSVTRQAMARMGWCPSGRLFEAAACGTAVLTDWWPGLDEFFAPGEEILVASTTGDVLDALAIDDGELARIGRQARERVLAQHTSEHRAQELLEALEMARGRAPAEV
ncbi:MAG TPA: glycosyltransferase [Stellaceae bacterium]|jgi:spore maturation protein CgeB